MSNESAPECLKHKDNRNVQVRLDYVLLYKSEVKAKIIRIIETWTNHKYAEWYKASADRKEQKQEPPLEDLWVTMSYEQLTIFVYGTAQHDTIKQYVDELVASKDIQRRPHPEIPYGPPQYLLDRKKVQDGLDALEIPPNLFDLSPLFLSPRKKHTPQEKYPPGRGINPPRVGVSLPPGRGENTPPSKKHTKKYRELPKKEDTRVASPNVDAYARANFEYDPEQALAEKIGHDPKAPHHVFNCKNWRLVSGGVETVSCADYQAAIDGGWHETPTDKQAAIKIGATTDGHQHITSRDHSNLIGDLRDQTHADQGDSGLPNPAPLFHRGYAGQVVDDRAPDAGTHLEAQVAIASIPGEADTPPAAEPRQSLPSPGDGAAPTPVVSGSESRASDRDVIQEKPKRRRGKGKETPPAEESPAEVVQFLDDWDSLHRAPLPRTDRLIALAKAGITAKVTREELEGCRNWLPTTDRPGKPYYRRKGVGLWDVIDKIGEYRSYLAMSIEPAPLADMKQPTPMDIYTAASLDPERNSIERLIERQNKARLKREAARPQGGAS